MDIEFKILKHKKNIWFVFDKKTSYNNKFFKNGGKVFYKHLEHISRDKFIIYNYSMNKFISHYKFDKVFGFELSFYTKDKSNLFNSENGNLM
jgi:hypothetical protein